MSEAVVGDETGTPGTVRASCTIKLCGAGDRCGASAGGVGRSNLLHSFIVQMG